MAWVGNPLHVCPLSEEHVGNVLGWWACGGRSAQLRQVFLSYGDCSAYNSDVLLLLMAKTAPHLKWLYSVLVQRGLKIGKEPNFEEVHSYVAAREHEDWVGDVRNDL